MQVIYARANAVVGAVMLALTLFCFNFLGDGLRDALDPRIRKD